MCFGYLTNALTSLHAQEDVVVYPIIVTQGFTFEELELLNKLVDESWYFSSQGEVKIINVSNPDDEDLRSKLLNIGIAHHLDTERSFFSILDYDDFLYSYALSELSKDCIVSGAGIAFGGIDVFDTTGNNFDFVYNIRSPFKIGGKLELLNDNFCPIHSYIINSDLLPNNVLFFNEEMTRLEDYDFLIRIVSTVPSSFKLLKASVKVGAYSMRLKGDNTTPILGADSYEIKKSEWSKNTDILNKRKASTIVTFFASDF